ncbi:MAG: YaiI/YqxD family protein [Gammaproteobacteria bacterium]|nr:YaiI/YqxD family protein [Gammaproteobacteria bacterium]
MRIWVDADAVPRMVRDILFRAVERVHIELTMVANKALIVPPSPYIKTQRVPGGLDVADTWIIEHVAAGDLVITSDIPLAAAIVARDAHALNPRGELYTKENIGERLAVRDLMEELRDARIASGGPPALNQRDRQAFANQLDRLLAQRPRVTANP